MNTIGRRSKKRHPLALHLLLTGGLAFGTALLAAPSSATISTQGHDFSCSVCHLSASEEDLENRTMPLWSSEALDAGAPYRSASLNADLLDPLPGPSRQCLSCHDGVLAPDVSIGMDGVGHGELRGAHPIGFDYYQVARSEREIKPASATFSGGIQVADVLYHDSAGRGIMGCTTCHDVHGTHADGDHLLYGDPYGSGLCLTCHDK